MLKALVSSGPVNKNGKIMTKNRYQQVLPIGRDAAKEAFSSGQPDQIVDALASLAFYASDWRWVQDTCLSFVESLDMNVRRIARIHGKLDMEKVRPVLNRFCRDAVLAGTVEDVLEDIEMFACKS